MKTLSLVTLLLASCAVQHEHTLKPGQKFVDGEVVGGRMLIQSRKAANEAPEIVLFQDGRGNGFTIIER